MKTNLVTLALVGMLSGWNAQGQDPETLSAQHLENPGLPPGSAQEVLPGNAILHLQLNDILGVVEGIEEIIVAAVPEKALPPDLQDLMASEHPVLTLMGMQTIQEPITLESVAQQTGLNARGRITLTLYPGDPRRLFILSLPMSQPAALARSLSGLLRPEEIERVDLGDGRWATRLVCPRLKDLRELFLLASDQGAFLTGDRSLAIALHRMPSAQRLARDPFLSRAVPREEDRQFRAVLNPALVKPLALQLQQFRPLAAMVIHQQRQQIVANLPSEAREQIEMQIRTELGLDSLEQFADYAEAVVVATLDQLVDFVTNRMIAFEGLTVTANLQGGFSDLNLKIYSQDYQVDNLAASIPMDELREALAWLGDDFQSFEVTGRKPEERDAPILSAWTARVAQQFQSRNLEAPILEKLTTLLEERSAIQPVESRASFTLTTYAPLVTPQPIEDARSLEEYFTSLTLPVFRPVTVVPGKGLEFLEGSLRDEARILNRNRELTLGFMNELRAQQPLLDHEYRVASHSAGPEMSRLVFENAWTTHGGLFGFDQHELVSRRIYHARQLDNYLVYHRGAISADWLGKFEPARSQSILPGIDQLLERVPEDANYIAVHRVLVGLPLWINWISTLEDRIHNDIKVYVKQAQAIAEEAANIEEAVAQIRRLPMPELVMTVNWDPDEEKIYCLLPGNLVFPRPKVVPLVDQLLKQYADRADAVGGSLAYTRVGPEEWECTVAQSTEALTTLISTVGNSLFETYLETPEKRELLQSTLVLPQDGDAEIHGEVIAQNPRWAFLPQPKAKRPAKPTHAIPAREPDAGDNLIDLTSYYNAALTETWHSGGLANNNLAHLPRGVQEFAEVPFDVRGLIQLSGRTALQELDVKFPKEVVGITVGQKATKLHFLHAAGWPSGPGTRIGNYTVHYSTGATRDIPIRYGRDVNDWWANDSTSPARVAWTGTNQAAPDGPPVKLYITTWDNPLPDAEITSLDFRTAMQNSAPFMVAITIE